MGVKCNECNEWFDDTFRKRLQLVVTLENERLAKEEAQRQLAEQLEVLNGEISVKDEVTTCSPSSCSFLRKDCATC